jgi:hypothetical protein
VVRAPNPRLKAALTRQAERTAAGRLGLGGRLCLEAGECLDSFNEELTRGNRERRSCVPCGIASSFSFRWQVTVTIATGIANLVN